LDKDAPLSAHARRQGYRITIDEHGSDARKPTASAEVRLKLSQVARRAMAGEPITVSPSSNSATTAPSAEFAGTARAHCDPRHGHIAGARNVPLEDLLDRVGTAFRQRIGRGGATARVESTRHSPPPRAPSPPPRSRSTCSHHSREARSASPQERFQPLGQANAHLGRGFDLEQIKRALLQLGGLKQPRTSGRQPILIFM